MAWIALGRLTYELQDGEIIVGSGADATWRIEDADLMPRHFVVTTNGEAVSVGPFSEDSVVAVDSTQVLNAYRLVDGAVVEAGTGRFLFSQDAPRGVATESESVPEAYLVERLADLAHPLNGRSTSIGRDASNNIVVRNPTSSRFHAEVRREAGGFAIHSMGSAGTVLNGKLMQLPALLTEGDTVEVAFTVFEFTRGPLPRGVMVAAKHAGENDDASRKPTIATEWVVDEDGSQGDSASPVWAILGLVWFLVFATLAWLRLKH